MIGNYDTTGNNNLIATYDDPTVILLSNLPSLTNKELEIYKRGIIHLAEKTDLQKVNLTPVLNYIDDGYDCSHHDGNPASFCSIFNEEELNTYKKAQLKLSSKVIKEFPLFANWEIYPAQLLDSYFVKPQYTNANIQKQQGLFYIKGLKNVNNNPAYSFKVLKEYKKVILAELKLFAGIDNSTIYSGLTGVANSNKDELFEEFIKFKEGL